MSKSLIIVVNDLGYFISHRLAIALAAKAAGYKVQVAFGEFGKSDLSVLMYYGIIPLFLPMRRSSLNPFAEVFCLFAIWRLFQRLQPDVVHLITIKPYLYGGIAARFSSVRAVVSAVAGLGTTFVRQNFRGRIFRKLLYPVFHFAFGHKNQCVIVQNLNDRDILVDWGVLKPEKVRLLRGSGVDLSGFMELDEPDGIPIVSFASRLLRDKGVFEFISSARVLRERGVQVRFWLIGDLDPGNPTSVTERDLAAWRDEGIVEVMGYRRDIPALYAQSHIVCLPSFYGEGLPKALIEAAAAGRAVVTTDHPGCRDAILPGETGLLVPVKNVAKLADALQWLIEHPQERAAMGRAGRALAAREFSIEKVVDAHLQIYHELLDPC